MIVVAKVVDMKIVGLEIEINDGILKLKVGVVRYKRGKGASGREIKITKTLYIYIYMQDNLI